VCGASSEGGTAGRSVIPGAGEGISGAGTKVSGAEWRIPKAGTEAVLLGAQCRHQAGEVFDFLQKCGFVGRWANNSDRRLGCDLGDAVCIKGCGAQATLMLIGEDYLYIGV
jgi:hypothetical protein